MESITGLSQPKTKLLTCYTWVSNWHWYQYAKKYPERVPWVLLDFSPCQDPFLDPYASTNEERQPVISGLCRALKVAVGQRFLFITRIDRRVYEELGYGEYGKEPRYFGIVALEVQEVWPSHQAAAQHFVARQYVVAPQQTNYPPNLAHSKHPHAAIRRECCIVRKTQPSVVDLMPFHSTDADWKDQYLAYHVRQKVAHLGVARCRVTAEGGREVLLLRAMEACFMGPHGNPAIFTPQDWGGTTLQCRVNGLFIQEDYAANLRKRIVVASR